MQAITVRDRDAGIQGLSLSDVPYPHAAVNDVIVRVHAAGFVPGELDWPTTWADRAGRDRTPSVPGHEVSGVVAELGYGTTGLAVGQRVFGLADWARDGSLAEYIAMEARNLAPLPAQVDHVAAAALPISGLTAWQALFDHAHLRAGQTALIHGAAGGVGSIAVQLARQASQAGGPVAQLRDDPRHLVPGHTRRPAPAAAISPRPRPGELPGCETSSMHETSFSEACGQRKLVTESPARPASRSLTVMACITWSSLMVSVGRVTPTSSRSGFL